MLDDDAAREKRFSGENALDSIVALQFTRIAIIFNKA